MREMQAAPTEIDLIRDTIDVLTNSSAPPEETLIALVALQSLVEPIDNANGPHRDHAYIFLPIQCMLIAACGHQHIKKSCCLLMHILTCAIILAHHLPCISHQGMFINLWIMAALFYPFAAFFASLAS